MRHLVIGQRQKAPNFSAFHWSPHGCLISIGQHFVTTRVVHLPKRTETSLITELDQSRTNHQLLQLCMACTAWSDSDQAVRALHSCKSWLLQENEYSSLTDEITKLSKAVPPPNSMDRVDVSTVTTRFMLLFNTSHIDSKTYNIIFTE